MIGGQADPCPPTVPCTPQGKSCLTKPHSEHPFPSPPIALPSYPCFRAGEIPPLLSLWGWGSAPHLHHFHFIGLCFAGA